MEPPLLMGIFGTFKSENILQLSAPAKTLLLERHIKTLSQRTMTARRLPTTIEHALLELT
jgi:hypothetical protein